MDWKSFWIGYWTCLVLLAVMSLLKGYLQRRRELQRKRAQYRGLLSVWERNRWLDEPQHYVSAQDVRERKS